MRLLLYIVEMRMEKGIYYNADKMREMRLTLSMLMDDLEYKQKEWEKIIGGCKELGLDEVERAVTDRLAILKEDLSAQKNILEKIDAVYSFYEDRNLAMVRDLCGGYTGSRSNAGECSLLERWTGKVASRITTDQSVIVENWLCQYLIHGGL